MDYSQDVRVLGPILSPRSIVSLCEYCFVLLVVIFKIAAISLVFVIIQCHGNVDCISDLHRILLLQVTKTLLRKSVRTCPKLWCARIVG